MIKKFISIILAFIMIGRITTLVANPHLEGSVYLVIENNTYPEAPFHGIIISGWYQLYQQDSMMSVVLRALEENGFQWLGQGGTNGNINDYTIQYLSLIAKEGGVLGEFTDGERESGWMGLLNDWFVNESFGAFTPEDGDMINIVYTRNLGVDCGGTWTNFNTQLKDLVIEGGTLMSEFISSHTEYELAINGDTADLRVIPTAENKNYLVKTFLGEKVTVNEEGESYYKRSQAIPVSVGDVVYIGVGEKAWPSMNNFGSEDVDYSPTWYELRIVEERCETTEIIGVTLSADEKMIFAVDVCLGEVDSAYIVAAAYGENNKMLRSWIGPIVTESGVHTMNFNIEDAITWKLMLWSNRTTIMPLCEAHSQFHT